MILIEKKPDFVTELLTGDDEHLFDQTVKYYRNFKTTNRPSHASTPSMR